MSAGALRRSGPGRSGDRLFAQRRFAAQGRHALLQLAARGVERVTQDDVDVLVAIAVGALHVDDDVLAGDCQLDLDVENLALMVVPVRRIDDDAAGLDAVGKGAQVVGELADAGLDGWGAFHVSEGDLDRDGHDVVSLYWTFLVNDFIVEPWRLLAISIDRRGIHRGWQEYTARSGRREPNLA